VPANLKWTRLPHVSSLWHQRACHSNPAINRLQSRQPNQFRQSDCTERPRFHSFRQSDADVGPLTYAARSLPSRSSRLKVTSGCVLAGRCAFLDTLRADLHTDTDSTSLMTPCPAAGRQETLPFKTIASAHQANELAQQMHQPWLPVGEWRIDSPLVEKV
jgi:hypothetical protein